MKKILIVDDVAVNRSILSQTLTEFGDYELIEASNGNEAISQFENEKPDLILMDIMMPEVDGCEATVIIKEKMGDDHIPIIFVTALSAEDSLANALESGGDDFISKPFNIDVLKSKISAHLRIRELTQQLNIKNNSLSRFNQRLIVEQELVEYFFENAIKESFLDEKYIKYHMSSMSVFNGDLLLSERGPQGGLYIIMGDFSGHGLTAAMGTLPVAMIFFKMVKNGLAVSDIAREINEQLHKLMPPGMFLTATILELNPRSDVISVWMGGMPESYWLSKEGDLKGLIHSQHMPLGILDDASFDCESQVFNIKPEDKIYIYSDGIVEAKNSTGEMFGDERLKETLLNYGTSRFDEVLKELTTFTGDNNQNDDITLVELNCQPIKADESLEESELDEKMLLWNLSVSLSAADMRDSNPVNKLSNMLDAMPDVSRHKGVLHVLLSEIYTNSLDHGILNIQSVSKTDGEKFIEYYKRRDEALLELDDAFINFNFKFMVENEHQYIEIKVEDSGSGYQNNNSEVTDEMLHGRGMAIIDSFSENISLSNDGKTLTVLYRL